MEEITLLEATPTQSLEPTAGDPRAYVDALLESLDRNPRTVDTYRKGVRYFFDWTQGQGITNPTRLDVKAYKDYLEATYKPTTAATYISAVKWLFKAIAEESGRPELNIAAGIRTSKPSRSHKRDALTGDQIKTILVSMPADTLAQKRDRAIVALSFHCGLRVVEVSRADVGDIRNTPRGPMLDIWGKARAGKEDSQPIHPNALEAVRDYLKARESAGHSPKESDPLFICLARHDYGGRITTRSVSGIIKANIKKYVLDSPRLTAHSVRHSAVNLLIQNGASLYEAQQFARHRNPATTEIYIHENEATLWDASNRLGDALSL